MNEQLKDGSVVVVPHDANAERGVLASFLISPDDVSHLVVERNISAASFFVPSHAMIFDALMRMVSVDRPEDRKAVDFITLANELKAADCLEQCGGGPYLNELFTFLPTAANVKFYLDIVQAKETLRGIQMVGEKFARLVRDQSADAAGLLQEFQIAATQIGTAGKGIEETARPLKEGIMDALRDIDLTYKNRGHCVGTPTGFYAIDRMTGGLEAGQLVIVAGRPSMGKSSMLWDMALEIERTKGPVLGFSLEMTLKDLAKRYICWEAEIDLGRVRDGFLSDHQMTRLPVVAQRLHGLKEWIDETPGISIQELRSRARRFKAKHPKMAGIVVDYLQLMKSRSKRAQENRQLEIGEISAGLKEMAKELGIPVIVGAQLNRDNDGPKSVPKLSNLRESGTIEQDADVVILLHRPHYYTKNEEDEGKAIAVLAKQRNGATGDVPLEFSKIGRFLNPAGEKMYSNNPRERQGGGKEEGEG